MAVRFILGRSGTGKTSYCVRAVVEALLDEQDKRTLVFLVPEQATFQAEWAILTNSRIEGYNRLHVLSFDRLAYLLKGRKIAQPTVSKVGRQMLVQRLLRANRDKLKIFAQLTGCGGIARQMSQAISELCRYGNEPDAVDEFIEQLSKNEQNALTKLKFADIALILREYLKFIEGRFVDPDVQLNSVRTAIANSTLLKGARLWVDGFAGFTGSELEILAELLSVCCETEIALCLDEAKKPGSGSEFEPTEKTYADILEIIKKRNAKLQQPIVLNKAVRFTNNPALAHLEKNFFEVSPQQQKAGDIVKIMAAANIRSEVEYVANEINRLIRENGLRYRDIAVVASTLDLYEHYIRAYLNDKRIPFFIDKRQSLNEHIAVKFIHSAIATVTDGFKNSDIFSHLKTRLAGIDSYDIDALENYCVAFGIRGDDWTDEHNWQFAGPDDKEFDEKQINQTRLKVTKPLIKLRDALGYKDAQWLAIGPDEFTKALFDFLDELEVYKQLNQWVEKATTDGDIIEAGKHQQFCEKFADVFDELAEAFTGQKLSCNEWAEIINLGLSQMTLALIPPSLDQVLIGSIERSRHPDLKAVFVIGCTQKLFPIPVSYDGLLTETDRAAAKANDFELGPGLRDNLTQREYLAYIAFTRPADFLYVSFPQLEGKGGSTVCSQYVNRLASLFSDVAIESPAADCPIEKVQTEAELSELLCGKLGRDSDEPDEKLKGLLDEMADDKQLAETAKQVNSAISYKNTAKLDLKTTAELTGEQINSSATKLSTFAACPYQYFARYELKLKERKEFTFEPLDKGLFYHKVLENLLKELNRRKIDIAELPDDELISILRERIAAVLRDDSFVRNFVGHSMHNAYIIDSASDNLEACVIDMAETIRAGLFRPNRSEMSFCDYEIKLANGRKLILRGKIDRIDEAQIAGQRCAVIFDYKLHSRNYSWSSFYYGLDMQLAIYMLAVRQAKLEPVGAFYIPIETGTSKNGIEFGRKAAGIFNGEFFAQLDGITETGWSKYYNFYISKNDNQYGNYRISGSLKKDDFEKVLAFTQQKIIELVSQITAGKIDVSPYRLNNASPCGYCKYKAVCRFDWQINNYRPLALAGKNRITEMI